MKPLNSPATSTLFISVDLLPGRDSGQHNLGFDVLIPFADKEALLLQLSKYSEHFIACLCPDLSIFP